MRSRGRYILIGLGIILLGAALYSLGSYAGWFGPAPVLSPPLPEFQPQEDQEAVEKTAHVPYVLETVATNLFVPWSLVFTSDTRLLVSERNGALRIIEEGNLVPEPLITFGEVSRQGEEGLMGLVLDPDYNDNSRFYACLAYGKNGGLVNKVVSLIDEGESARAENLLLDDIPSAQNHAGCRLMFLSDKTLLITTGDATNRADAQKLESLAGKILRLNRDGSVPSDNPWPDSPVYTFGHRNPQGLAYDGEREMLWASEHGPSLFDGPAGGDEINIIETGNNYGWPVISHDRSAAGMESPVIQFTPATAPASLLYYASDALPQFTGNLFYGGLRGEGLYRLVLNPDDPRRIASFEKLSDVDVGRIRDVVAGPDGSIYFTTSNRDGRGRLRANDDKIYRLRPNP